jgi:hypothetical protein
MNNSIIYHKWRTSSCVDGILVVERRGTDHLDDRFLVSQIRATVVTKMIRTRVSARSPRRNSLARCEMMVAHLDATTLETCKYEISIRLNSAYAVGRHILLSRWNSSLLSDVPTIVL